MKKDRHYYYQELKSNNELALNKEWLKKALKCTLEEHVNWAISENSLEQILDNKKYTKNDYLDFISMNNKLIAKDLRVLEKIDTEFEDTKETKINFIEPKYNKSDFPNMRDGGFVRSTIDYTIAHYEFENYRIFKIAEKIKDFIDEHFILYDYKGNVRTNSLKVINLLNGLYPNGIELEGDLLNIDDGLLEIKINPVNKQQNLDNEVQYWHMQLHPDYQSWGKEKELLEELSLIGLGKTKSEHAYKDFEKMRLNDIVLIKNGSEPIALVRVIGNLESLNENKDEIKHLDWFKYRRKVNVLEFARQGMDEFPQPRGTLSIAKNKDTDTYKYIDNWFNSISSKSTIAMPKQINIKNATPAFGVKAIAKILSEIIANIPDKSGMMVGVFGKWGRGKTYLVDKIWEDIIDNKDLNYKRITFSAWKYQDTKESWAYLYEVMMNQYLIEGKQNNFIKDFILKYTKLWKLNLQKHKWFPIISFSMIFIFSIYWNFCNGKIEFIKFLLSSFGIIISIKLLLLYFHQKTTAIGLFNKYFSKKSYSDFLGLQAEVENELENLVKTWIPNTSNKEKIILFVDDIDRCNIEQIISIVDGLRVILDNPEIHTRLIIVTAIDEEILRQALIHKYSTIKDETTIKLMYKEYLEKVFIIGIKLNQLEDDEIEEFLIKIIPELNDKESIESEKIILDDTIIHEEPTIKNKIENTSFSAIDNDGKHISEDDLELTKEEKNYLIKSIKNLDNATPRKIRIFYYKYLILKKLFHTRLEEKVIMDILIHISNQKSLDDFNYDGINMKLIEALKYTSNMVSAL